MSENDEHVKQHIERAIGRARSGVSENIDELDRRLRGQLDVKKKIADMAPQFLAAGAVVGFLVGFGVPKVLKKAITIGVPIFLALRIAKAQSEAELEDQGSSNVAAFV